MANRNKKMVYHIYWGTAGNAGLYLDEIYQVLDNAGYKQKAFVNYYYPFDYGEKVFYKLTELGHCKIKRFRGPVRYLELLWAILRILINTIVDRPRVINYSIIGSFDVIRYYLIFCQKALGCKIVLTCHDVIPSASSLQDIKTEIEIRKKIFNVADFFLIHNDFSRLQLKEFFGVDEKIMVMHPFPIMDLSKIVEVTENYNKKCDFLFIGHIRKEKGVDVLLEAWESLHVKLPDATLTIAGNLPPTEEINVSDYEHRKDVKFILQFLSDTEYCQLIRSSRFVVMPYTHGTNSGVVSTVLALGADVIASDIQMFVQNPLIDKNLIFKAGSVESLAHTLEKAFITHGIENRKAFSIQKYKEIFKEKVLKVYNTIIQ